MKNAAALALAISLLAPSAFAQRIRVPQLPAGIDGAMPESPQAAVGHRVYMEPGWDDGRNAAAQVCAGLSFDSNRPKCLRTVNQAGYFERGAVDVCGRQSFDDDKLGCLAAIADKTFLPAEIETCGRSSFGSEVASCFQTAGRPADAGPVYEPRPSTDSFILHSLQRIRWELERGDVPRALVDLGVLMRFVEDGMQR